VKQGYRQFGWITGHEVAIEAAVIS
jgi:hypothetical protein